MVSVRTVISAPTRRKLRRQLDSFFCVASDDKETIGASPEAQWTVRKRDFNAGSIVYSGGVGPDISFELELIRRYDLHVWVFDPSPVALRTIHSLADMPEMKNLNFQPVGLSGSSGSIHYSVGGDYEGDNGTWFRAEMPANGTSKASGTMPTTTITEQMRRNGHTKLDLLKLDIEGFEYDVLKDCIANRLNFTQLCVEFHHFFPDIPITRTVSMIRHLQASGLRIIHKKICDYTFYRE